jgi:hypothetical protein
MNIEQQIEILNKEVEVLKNQVSRMVELNILSTHVGFIARYESEMHKHSNLKKTYESVEDIYFDLAGCFRYTSYEYFRTVLCKFRPRLKK